MSYIQVSDINETVRIAEKYGAKIELGPEPGLGGELVALIRDPAGAGFTCYQGEDLGGKDETGADGRMVWNELHVSDLSKVDDFYTNVFGWEITGSKEDNQYDIHDSSGQLLAGIRVFENEIKGDKEYWGVYFCVESIQNIAENISRAGGEIALEQIVDGKKSALVYDSQGAAFFLFENKSTLRTSTDMPQSAVKWRAILGLGIVLLSVVFDAMWIWGILFLIWIVPDIKSGSTHFLEHVERRENPVIFWLIVGTWLALSLYLFADVFDVV